MKISRFIGSRFSTCVCLGLLVSCGLFCRPALAQAVYGSVRGMVMGPAGEPIRDATITATSVEKGTEERTTTNPSGGFTITHLLSDTYNIKAETTGYKPVEFQGQEVYADQTVTLELKLEKGSMAGAAVRSAEASPLLKTDRADVATSLSAQEVRDLPNFNRNFTAFELLAPGIFPTPILENTSRPSQNPQQGLTIYMNGQHFGASAFLLDGTDNRDPIAGLIVINPSLESISEVKITTQNFDAEFGQALAGLVTAQIRSGSNTLHGSLFELHHSSWAEAGPPDLQNLNVTNNPFHDNEFGGSVGGPIVANRLFFFADYQGNRRALDFTRFTSVPTQKVFDTCLNQSGTYTYCDLSDYSKAINFPVISGNPNDGMQFTCTVPGTSQTIHTCIPYSFLAQPALNLLQLLPQPNNTANALVNGTVQNYKTNGVEPFNDDEFDLRIDQNVNSKFKLFGRYSYFDSRITALGAFGSLLGGTGVSSDNFAGISRSHDGEISAGFDYLLSPRLSTDFRFGFYRYHLNILQGGVNTTPATTAGLLGLNLGDYFTSGMPGITMQEPTAAVNANIAFGYSQEVNDCNCPLIENEQQFQWANNWTRLSGNHNLKWGVDFRYAENLRVPSDRHRAGFLQFGGNTTGLALASFLMGYSNQFSRYIGDDFTAGERQHRYFFYGQDSWRLTSRFTLTYGLRWEIYAPQSVTGSGQGGFLDTNTGMINVAGEGSTNLHGNVRNSFTNLAPRLGFAYQALPRTVLRAAYGRSFDLGSLGSVFGDTVTQNLPVLEYEQFLSEFKEDVVYDIRGCPPSPPGFNNGPNCAPTIPTASNGLISLPNNIAADVLPTRMQIPTIDAWNFSIQHQVNPNTSVELAFVGNKGTHVFPFESSNASKTASYNLNQATIQGFYTTNPNNCAPTNTGGTAPLPCVSTLFSRQPYYKEFTWEQQISYYGNTANDRFESMQAKLERRFTKGFEVRAFYTWSRGLGYVQDYFDINPRVNYGPNDFDRKHSFILTNLWDLPVGRGKPLLGNSGGWLNRVVGGWQINTASYVYSGLPFSPTYSSGECSDDGDTGPCRPNQVGPVDIIGNRNDWFTLAPAAFASPAGLAAGSATCESTITPCPPNSGITLTAGSPSGPWERPAPGTFGSARRNSLRGPTYFDTDLALLKNVALTERSSLQFRGDVTNLFNRVNLGLPSGCVDCSGGSGGVITNLANNASMRQLEFALRVLF